MSDQENPRPGPSVRLRVGIGAAIVLVVGALVCSVLITALSPVGATTALAPRASGATGATGATGGSSTDAAGGSAADGPTGAGSSSSGSASVSGGSEGGSSGDSGSGADGAADASGAAILVHVLGAVATPGVYELAEGSRVFDAVGLAGGFTDSADQASVNLARLLTDGEQLRVLVVGEPPPAAEPPAAGSGGGAAAGQAGAGQPGGSALNLNSATTVDLDGLPRIGPAMAGRIVAWRDENGPFTAVDDLLQVTGIGEKTLDGLRDLVTV